MAFSIGVLLVFGLNLGIEFTGGSLLEVQYEDSRPQIDETREQLSLLGVGISSVQPIGEQGLVIRMADLSPEQHEQVLMTLGEEAVEQRFESIGPVIGKELREKALLLGLFSFLAIILYVTFAFRKITRPVQSWQWSVTALLALLHDVFIPLGALALLGEFMGVQLTIPVVVALLIVVGYSVNDTVVIFDRVRENLARKVGFDFADTVNKSLVQSLSRSVSTSFTTLLVVVSLFFFGGETLHYFALVMILGIIAGTYSSLFLAPVLIVKWGQWTKK